ncbi:hypothetical protein ABIB15_002967 [Marisediminicola sp. UYEF4]|uniref:hypothetical protein n=1 Tax=Marisediminicola sp. UYEF4 TaxID=1756384 RepID=UPI003397F81D
MDEWLACVAPGGIAIGLTPSSDFLILMSKGVLLELSGALSAFANSADERAATFRSLGRELAEDISIMEASPTGEKFPVGVHPWCLGDSSIWEFVRLPDDQVAGVVEEIRRDPELSDPLVGRYEDYMPLFGDSFSAQRMVDALDAQQLSGDMLVVRESFRDWVAWAGKR